MDVPWQDLCTEAAQHRLRVTTVDGRSTTGECSALTAQSVTVGVRRVNRLDVARIEMLPNRRHLIELGDEVSDGLGSGIQCLASRYFLYGLWQIPAALVWGVVDLPIAVCGDIIGLMTRVREIRIK